eukprot:GHVR01107658.1.p1 GENE.GHVR01107658.1~~GHVR01107658.1.p1  ORF type:complete len:284 (-),score=45.71 GHVR01107658.1:178-1029(-)
MKQGILLLILELLNSVYSKRLTKRGSLASAPSGEQNEQHIPFYDQHIPFYDWGDDPSKFPLCTIDIKANKKIKPESIGCRVIKDKTGNPLTRLWNKANDMEAMGCDEFNDKCWERWGCYKKKSDRDCQSLSMWPSTALFQTSPTLNVVEDQIANCFQIDNKPIFYHVAYTVNTQTNKPDNVWLIDHKEYDIYTRKANNNIDHNECGEALSTKRKYCIPYLNVIDKNAIMHKDIEFEIKMGEEKTNKEYHQYRIQYIKLFTYDDEKNKIYNKKEYECSYMYKMN